MVLRRFLPFLLLVHFGIGCTGGAESGPVTLPVPFSGTLVNATVLVAEGLPTQECLLSGHRSGNQWPLVDSQNRFQGHVTFDCDSFQETRNENGRREYSVDICFDLFPTVTEEPRDCFDPMLVGGSQVVVENEQFFDFDYPVQRNSGGVTPNFNLDDFTDPGETDASILTTSGSATGFISQTDAPSIGAEGQTVNHKFVYQEILHADGTRTFIEMERGLWLIHR